MELTPEQKETKSILHPQQTGDDFSFIDLLEPIVKRSRMIVGITVGSAVVAIVVSLLLPNRYTATTLIFAPQEDKGLMASMMSQMGGFAALAGGSFAGKTTEDLYVSMLKSEAVKDPIIDRFKLMSVYDLKLRSDVYRKLDKNVTVSIGKKDGIIAINVEDADPKRAAEMANACVGELEKLAVNLNVNGAGKNRVFFEQRLAQARADLAKSEDALKTFQLQNKAVNVTEQAKATIEGVAQLRGQLAVQEVQLSTLRRTYTDSSADVKNLLATIGNLKAQIAKLEGQQSGSSIPSMGTVPQIGQQYVRLMREFKIQETLVELLTKQYEMARLSENKDVSPLQVLQKAKLPDRKSKPKRSVIVIATVLFALFSSMLFAYVLHWVDRLREEDRRRLAQLKERFERQLFVSR